MKTDPGFLTEFVDGLNGTCGETALAFAISAATNSSDSEQEIVDLFHQMQGVGQAGPNGESTLWALAREAERRGQKVLLEWDYAEPFNHDWHQILLDNKGKNPVVLEVANGQALKDVETGSGENATNLHYHFICVLDSKAEGYVVGDGDNFQDKVRYQVYSYQTLINAKPCGLLMLDGHYVAPTPPPDPKDAEIAALKAQVAQLQAELAKAVPADLHSFMSNLSNLLAPFGSASAECASLMKELGY